MVGQRTLQSEIELLPKREWGSVRPLKERDSCRTTLLPVAAAVALPYELKKRYDI